MPNGRNNAVISAVMPRSLELCSVLKVNLVSRSSSSCASNIYYNGMWVFKDRGLKAIYLTDLWEPTNSDMHAMDQYCVSL